jgi:peptidylprolyl isomerase domain and WD repeat-containing protein 1
MYERSYMHKEIVSHILVAQRYDFIVTVSIEGVLKFWRKVQSGIEFVKTFRPHLGRVSCVTLSANELRLASVSPKDQSLKVFDVANFDLMHFLKLKFEPNLCEFIHRQSAFGALVAVTQANSPVVHIIKAETAEG